MSALIDTPVGYAAVGIFVVLWSLGVAAWFYGAWEAIQVSRLQPSAFKYGRVILSSTRSLPHPDFIVFGRERIVTDTGQFRFVGPAECVFSRHFSWFRPKFHTPFPIKGRIHFSDSNAEIEGRAPLGPSIFFGAWILAWPIPPALLLAAGKMSIVKAGLFIGLGLGGAFGMVAISLVLEGRRAKTIIDEIELHLSRRGLAGG